MRPFCIFSVYKMERAIREFTRMDANQTTTKQLGIGAYCGVLQA